MKIVNKILEQTSNIPKPQQKLIGVVSLGLHSIGKLRCDSNLRHLDQGPQKPLGRNKKFGEKICFDDLCHFELTAVENKDFILRLSTVSA